VQVKDIYLYPLTERFREALSHRLDRKERRKMGGNSRRRPEEISEFIDLYPEKCNKCGGRIKAYEKNYDEHNPDWHFEWN
jgi:hypothetical protein